MDKKPLYSIGHGHRSPETFLELLRKFDIRYLVDVRSQPFSKFNPAFNQSELRYLLESNGIRYVFMGDTIGGRPNDPHCYDEEGKVDYEAVKSMPFFLAGIERLKAAYAKDLNLVMMCSESKPGECHRSKLIGKVLEKEKIQVQHIDEKGKTKSQFAVISELNKGLNEVDLFGNPLNATSRKSYQ